MYRLTLGIILLTTLAFLSNCKKHVDCENAQLCVENIGNDTIYYCWGCNSYNEILLPKEKACIDVGPVTVNFSEESTTVQYFRTNGITYAIEVAGCDVLKQIE